MIEGCRYYHRDDLRKALADAPALDAAFDRLQILGIGYERSRFGFGTREAFAFAARHLAMGHEVRVADEYGQLDDQCGHWYKCSCCKADRACELTEKHEGPHGPKAEP